MNLFPSSSDRQNIFDFLIIVLVGVTVTIVLISASGMEEKWTKASIMGIIALSGISVIPKREQFFFYLAILFLPTDLDFHLVHQLPTPFMVRPINGFKITAVDIFFFFSIIAWIYRLTKDAQIKIRLYPWISIPFCLILILSLIGLKKNSVSGMITISVLWLLIKNGFIVLYVSNNLKQSKALYITVGILLLTGSFQGLIGIAQYVKGGTLGLGLLGETEIFEMGVGTSTVSRIGGTLGHANQFAMFMGFLVQINLALLFARTITPIKRMLCISFIIMLTSLILTYSRGGMSGLILSSAVNASWCIGKRTGHKVIAIIVTIAFLFITAAAGLALIKPLQRRFFEDDGGSADLRPQMRIVAKNIIRDNPWFGVGLNNYTSAIYKYDTTAMAVSYDFPKPVHHEFFLICAEQGLPVIGLFFLMLAVIFIRLISIGRSHADSILPYIAIGFFCGWITWCFQIQFDYYYTFFATNIWLYFSMILAMKEVLASLKHYGRPDR